MMDQDGVEGGLKLHKDVSIFICPTCVHFHSLARVHHRSASRKTVKAAAGLNSILTVSSISIN